jgi:hypothetical protein
MKRQLSLKSLLEPNPKRQDKKHSFVDSAQGRKYATQIDNSEEPSQLTMDHIAELMTKGYTVVEDILSTEYCNKIKAQWLATMESYKDSGFLAHDRSRWHGSFLPNNLRGMQNWPV